MSITCAFMSSKPSSNTANRPQGPAPMISTSVLIVSDMHCSRDSSDRGRRTKVSAVRPRRCGSRLPFGRPHHQAVELGGHLDLAGQARIRPNVVAEVEHVLLHRRRLTHRRAPRFVDMHMAGRAGAGATAFRLDAGNAVLDRRLHDGRADLALDRTGGTFEIDVSDLRHAVGREETCGGARSYSRSRERAPDRGTTVDRASVGLSGL